MFIAQRHQGDHTIAVVPSPSHFLKHWFLTSRIWLAKILLEQVGPRGLRLPPLKASHTLCLVPYLISSSIGATCWGTPPPSSRGTPCSSLTKLARYQVWHIDQGTILDRVLMMMVPSLYKTIFQKNFGGPTFGGSLAASRGLHDLGKHVPDSKIES